MWLLSALSAVAAAADWPMVQGTEPAGADPIRPWGFLQVVGEAVVGGAPATGLSAALAPFEGVQPSFNRVGAGDARQGIAVRRARAGLRGAVPKTGDRVAWLLALEFGDNGVTRFDPVVATDVSVSASYVPGLRLRAGQFKLPLGEEALEMNPIAAEFVNVSAATGQLLAESPVAGGAYTGGASGFRDVGVQAFDTFAVGGGELSYALMVSNGRMGGLEIDDAKDLTGRLAWTPAVWGERGDARRDEVGAWVFHQQGARVLDGEPADRLRQGVGAKLTRDGWQVRAELIHASGMVELGGSPPFPGQPVTMAAAGRAIGGYASVHRGFAHAAFGLRYDALDRAGDGGADRRVSRTLTADAQLIATPKARVLVDYERRWLSAPGGSADARAIAATLGDRVSVQATAVF